MYKNNDVTPHAQMMDDMDYASYRFCTAQYENLMFVETFKTGIVVPAGSTIRLIALQKNVTNASVFGDSVIWVIEDL